jgi:hypothetical protein
MVDLQIFQLINYRSISIEKKKKKKKKRNNDDNNNNNNLTSRKNERRVRLFKRT